MNDRKLVRKLFLVVIIKVLVLFGIWWAFFHGNQVSVTNDNVLPLSQSQSQALPLLPKQSN